MTLTRELLDQIGWTEWDLARRLACGQSVVSNWSRGVNERGNPCNTPAQVDAYLGAVVDAINRVPVPQDWRRQPLRQPAAGSVAANGTRLGAGGSASDSSSPSDVSAAASTASPAASSPPPASSTESSVPSVSGTA